MQLMRYIVRPLSPWGTPLRSDTLSGLILLRIAERQGESAVHSVIEDFCHGKPPFVVSSVMPCNMIFNPRLPPVSRAIFQKWVDNGSFCDVQGKSLSLFDVLQKYKKFRKKPYLPLEVWEKNASKLSLRPLLAWFCMQNFDELAFNGRDSDSLIQKSMQSIEPHVSIDRSSGSASSGGLFFNHLTWFSKDHVMHLYARTEDSEGFLNLLREVGDLGFGKDASTGKGRFSVEPDRNFDESRLSIKGSHRLLCSVLGSPDLDGLDGWYAVETKRGKAGPSASSPFKNPLLLIQEGSVLKNLPKTPYALSGIHPDSKIVQVTEPLLLPCSIDEE